MRPENVHVQNCHTQMGVEEEPLLAWSYGPESSGQQQAAYRVLVHCGGALCYDSGTVASARQNGIPLDFALQTHTRYGVRVGVTNGQGLLEWSDEAFFTSGVCRPQDWRGGWISNNTAKPYYACARFVAAKPVRQAVVSACGLGQFCLYLNGAPASGNVLEGSWTNFHQSCLYATYDVTACIREGQNDLALEVANGWYIGDTADGRHFYTLDKGYQPYGRVLPCILLLTLRYTDGTVETMATDESWRTRPSPTMLANIFGSEDFDARRAVPLDELYGEAAENAYLLEGEDIPAGALRPALHPPVRVKQSYNPVAVRKTATGLLYDFGQNMSGLFEVTVQGRRGAVVKMTTAEKLDADGNLLPRCNTYSLYTLAGGGPESWRPHFTYQAGRWLHIEFPGCVGEWPQVLGAQAHFTTSSAQDTGTFACSDIRLMQVHDLILKAAESNLNHVHSDCPTVERLGWLEPNHLMAPSLMYAKNLDTLWSKIAADMREAQYPEGEHDTDRGVFPHQYGPGLIPSVAPRYARFLHDFGDGSFWDIIPWGSSIILAAAWQAEFYGNRQVARENYQTAVRYLDYQYDKYEHYNEIYGKTGDERYLRHGLGDWGYPVKGDEARENVETAFLYHDYALLAQTATRLGLANEAKEHRRRADEILARYNRDLLQYDGAKGRWYYQMKNREAPTLTQSTQAIPLAFGMVPEDKRPDVEAAFLETVADGQLRAGEVALPFVFENLMRLDRHDLIYQMAVQPQHPSYHRFALMGETTLPEFWEDDARSRCHDMMGSIMAWFYRGLGGITSRDAFTTIDIAPHLPDGLSWVHCRYQAVTGDIEVRFEQLGEGYTLRVTLPPNTSGTLRLPTGFAFAPGGPRESSIPLLAGQSVFRLVRK